MGSTISVFYIIYYEIEYLLLKPAEKGIIELLE